jgi:hypothetical protein
MVIKNEISQNLFGFRKLCQEHHVKFLYAFGSSTTDKFNSETSDIDLLVEVEDSDPIVRGENLISLWDNFEVFFHRKVDMLTESSIHNPYLRQNIDSTKVILYDGAGSKVFV